MTSPSRADIILYDGVCGLCNGFVQFVLPRDREGIFRFAALQSPVARDLLSRHGKDPTDLDTISVVVSRAGEGERLLQKSRAVLHVFWRLGVPWTLSALFAPLPTRLLDAAYDVVARNRYKLFGKSDTCVLPAPEWRDRFLDT